MSAPVLRHKLVLESAGEVPDGMGGVSRSWAALGTLWADLKPRSAREGRGPGGAVALAGYRITVRAAPVGDARRPVPGQRLALGTRRFAIEAVTEADALGRYLICHATEEVAP